MPEGKKYEIHLDNFDGPLDLLLHLIDKNKMDIYDIPIAVITEQYLQFLDEAREMDLEIASEFLLIAATLPFAARTAFAVGAGARISAGSSFCSSALPVSFATICASTRSATSG